VANERGQGNQNADQRVSPTPRRTEGGEHQTFPIMFVAGAPVEKLSSSWNDYKQ